MNTVKRNFYVDNCLKSVKSEQVAIHLVKDLTGLLKKGGFRLTKWRVYYRGSFSPRTATFCAFETTDRCHFLLQTETAVIAELGSS